MDRDKEHFLLWFEKNDCQSSNFRNLLSLLHPVKTM